MLSALFYLSMFMDSFSTEGTLGGFYYLGRIFISGILFIIYFSERDSELC
jgi:hypothetical protein